MNAPLTRLLSEYLHSLQSLIGKLDKAEEKSAQEAMLTLLGAGIKGVAREEMQSLPVNLPMRKTILAYIDHNLFNPLLGPNLIVQNLRVSRSRLYRTFDTEGGIATIIREKRLDHAYRILVGECSRQVSFKEIAYRCGFHDGAQFTRAFKTRFGMSPKEARETKAPLLSSDMGNFNYTIRLAEEAAKLGVVKPYPINRGKTVQKVIAPVIDVVGDQKSHHAFKPFLAFGKRHSKRAGHGIGHRLGVIGIDQKRAVEFLRGASKTGQHQHAGIFRVLCRDIFLGDKVHPVTQRRDQSDSRQPIKPGQHLAVQGTVDIAYRRPVDRSVCTVHPTGQFCHSALHILVFRHFGRDFGVTCKR